MNSHHHWAYQAMSKKINIVFDLLTVYVHILEIEAVWYKTNMSVEYSCAQTLLCDYVEGHYSWNYTLHFGMWKKKLNYFTLPMISTIFAQFLPRVYLPCRLKMSVILQNSNVLIEKLACTNYNKLNKCHIIHFSRLIHFIKLVNSIFLKSS